MLASLEVGLKLVLDLGLIRKRNLYMDLFGMVIKLFVGEVLWIGLGWANRAWLKVTFSCLSTFRVTNIYIIGKMTLLSLYERLQIYHSVSRKSETSVGDLATLALVARSTTGVFSRLHRI